MKILVLRLQNCQPKLNSNECFYRIAHYRNSLTVFDTSIVNEKRYYYRFVRPIKDLGNGIRMKKIADHALVFMISCIIRKFKQPVLFTFCEGTTATDDLVRLIKEVVRKVRKAGLYVVSTICDQRRSHIVDICILSYFINKCNLSHNVL